MKSLFKILLITSFIFSQKSNTIAIVGVTLIDGNGGPAIKNATVVISGQRIISVGPGKSIRIPNSAKVINGSGKFLIPGFVDTNVHISLGGSMESNVRYQDQRFGITLEGAQMHLKYGVTTIRDSYGIMKPLLDVRDAINRGDEIGPRMYVAGNIVGWGGFYAETFGLPTPTTLWQEQFNDDITRGSGEELILMNPNELKEVMHKYIDQGVDFIKYGGTTHKTLGPTTLIFSPRQVKAIVDVTHKRGLIAETHAISPEGLLIALEAGVDLIQHPEILGVPIADELLQLMVKKKVICSININSHTGKKWQDYLSERSKPETTKAVSPRVLRPWPPAQKTAHQIFVEDVKPNVQKLYRANAERIIRAGCIVSVATDNDLGTAPEFSRDPGAFRAREPGFGTLISIEGLVELGMTPMQAIVSATKHGALASNALDEYGTIEIGKYADLLLLDNNPLKDIGNIRSLSLVMTKGKVIDHQGLPTNPIYNREKPTKGFN